MRMILSRRGIRAPHQMPSHQRAAYMSLVDHANEIADRFEIDRIPVVVNIATRRSLGRFMRMRIIQGAPLVNWIEISSYYFDLHGLKEAKDTIGHEMAHYIAWPVYAEDGHTPIWKQICREIGCSDSRTFQGGEIQSVAKEEEKIPEHLRGRGYKWVYKCECGQEFYRTRRYTEEQAKRRFCRNCMTHLDKIQPVRL